MALAPIGTYFSTNWYLFDGNPTYSAIAAVVVANIVLVTYVTIAFREDQRDQLKKSEGGGGVSEKGRIPGSGKKTD
ncbi:hypothetical protein BDY24DRAFT_70118 [Mrakia frigida]|uniref:Vma21p n=1 Tax=Mrakia frigida TaxID=29902 RepID=UPI003FCBEECE